LKVNEIVINKETEVKVSDLINALEILYWENVLSGTYETFSKLDKFSKSACQLLK